MAGGHATQAGIAFQNGVAAIFAVHALAEQAVPFLELADGAHPSQLWLEAPSPVDDIIVQTTSDGLCFVNVKLGVQVSSDPNSPLGSVIEQFVRQVLLSRIPDNNHPWVRPLSAARDRLVLVTGGTNTSTLIESSSAVLTRIRNSQRLDSSEISTTKSQVRFSDALIAQIRHHWTGHAGVAPSDAEIVSLVTLIRIHRADLAGADQPVAVALLSQKVLDPAASPIAALHALTQHCQEIAKKRSSTNPQLLRSVLQSAGLRLKDSPRSAEDIRKLKNFTKETLSSLSHLSQLQLPEDPNAAPFRIQRGAIEALGQHAPNQSFLLLGDPGAGKSGALFSAAEDLIKAGHPVVVIAVDRHPVPTLQALAADLGLTASVVEVLQSWTTEKTGVVFIDALDAARGGSSEPVFQDLVRDILKRLPTWRVVASIRAFDLKFGIAYRDMFLGAPVDNRFRHLEFPTVRHLLVPKLTQLELSQIWAKSPLMKGAYQSASLKLRALLDSPFNLFLLATILRSPNQEELQGVSTQAELLDRYWSYRVIGHDNGGIQRERVLSATVRKMLERKSLALDGNDFRSVAETRAEELLSEGVLSPIRFRSGEFSLVGFSHHVLFDYAVARLYFENGAATDLATKVTSSDSLALLLAPGATIALKILWAASDRHREFWSSSIGIAGAPSGAFSRMLPARVAAECTVAFEDWQIVYDELQTRSGDERKALLFLIRHALGALSVVRPEEPLVTNQSPWFSIIRRMIEVAAPDLRYMVRPFIHDISQKPEVLTASQLNDTGASARMLLLSSIGNQYDPSIISVSVPAIIRTFTTNIKASNDALRAILTPTHVSLYGHTDLFWLTYDVHRLFAIGPEAAELAEAIYAAAFCSPLPSKDEITNLGNSRLLALRSNKRQDFEGSRHRLVEKFSEFVRGAPSNATRTLLAAIEHFAKEERPRLDETVELFSFGASTAKYRADWSVTWGDYHHNDAVALVAQFKRGVAQLIQDAQLADLDKVIAEIVDRNESAGVWAALLDLGLPHPKEIGYRLLPLLSARPVLEGMDTRHQVGKLIEALHGSLGTDEKERIERAILGSEESSQQVLLSCLDETKIATPEAQNKLIELKATDALRENTETFSVRSGWMASDKNWWLREQGVNLDVEPNATIQRLSSELADAVIAGRNSPDNPTLFADHWNRVVELLDVLLKAPDAAEPLSMQAWNSLAEAADVAALACKAPRDLESWPRIAEIIFGALKGSHWPKAEYNAESEESFAKSPSWSSPAPRVAGADALMAFARAEGRTSPEAEKYIKELSRDLVPAVRYQIQARINMLFEANRELMFSIIDDALENEKNSGVLSGLLSATFRVLGNRPQWLAERLIALDRRSLLNGAREGDEKLLTQAILFLWIQQDVHIAEERVREWITDPVGNEHRMHAIATSLRTAIVFGDPFKPDPKDDTIRLRAIQVLEGLAQNCARIAAELEGKFNAPSAEAKERYISAMKTLDLITTEIYFGSGSYDRSNGEGKATPISLEVAAVKRRFLRELQPTLDLLAAVPHANVTHYLLQTLEDFIEVEPALVFRLAMRALVEGGKSDSYQFESMGADLFVRIVRRYIADYQALIASDIGLQTQLINALDIFADVGWPAARQLVYELPEMLR